MTKALAWWVKLLVVHVDLRVWRRTAGGGLANITNSSCSVHPPLYSAETSWCEATHRSTAGQRRTPEGENTWILHFLTSPAVPLWCSAGY